MKEKRQTEAAFTLVELLIAVALLLILIGPLLSFMKIGQVSRSTALRLTDVEQNARGAMISISRDLENAGYNFAPSVPLGDSKIVATLLGKAQTGSTDTAPIPDYVLSPIIPGNDLNLVRTVDPKGKTVTNATDQITLIFVDQSMNNGLPLSGNIPEEGDKFTSLVPLKDLTLYKGDFVVVSQGTQFAIATITAIDKETNVISFENKDAYGINQPGNPSDKKDVIPLRDLGKLTQQPGSVGLYKFLFITYFVDGNGNLIRREQLPPPHTAKGGNDSKTLPPPAEVISPTVSKYECAGNCYVDNIIATGIEDLQFTYYLADPGNTGVVGPVDDPGYYGRDDTYNDVIECNAPKCGAPQYRLLDIRQVNVSIKARAAERDNQIHDPYNPKQGYLYRFSLTGTFNTRNFYGADYR